MNLETALKQVDEMSSLDITATREVKALLIALSRKSKKIKDVLWKPQDGDCYYCVDIDGTIIYSNHHPAAPHDALFSFYNYFQTREQAERHSKRLRLFNHLVQLADTLNGKWKHNWRSRTAMKFYIAYCRVENEFKIRSAYISPSEAYFKSAKAAQQALNLLTDEEKEIFKGNY